VHFIETSAFTRRIVQEMSDNEYRRLQEELLDRPTAGDLIRGSGGLRKLRWAGQSRGKRGGLRIVYYWHAGKEIYLMLYVYPKNEQGDLKAEQRRVLSRIVREELE
jgi:mRNA-degrading endonuclease RelE of RelBE toxin-antitoxin system